MSKESGYGQKVLRAQRVERENQTMDFDAFVKAMLDAGWAPESDTEQTGAKALWLAVRAAAFEEAAKAIESLGEARFTFNDDALETIGDCTEVIRALKPAERLAFSEPGAYEAHATRDPATGKTRISFYKKR